MAPADAKLKEMEDENVRRIGEISVKIRESIRKALPTPPEQFMTVMVPGKVVNFDDYKIEDNTILLPLKTELNQAILCDDMPVLSTIQMGPTGKSVARSYASAISKLVPAGTTVGIDDGKPMTPDQTRYKQAMKILSSDVPDRPGMSLVELYTEKQTKYTNAVAQKTKAFADAYERVQKDPTNRRPSQIREAYDKWVQENARTYRSYVQAAYMDWVITGKKEEVEYWFSVVDQDSALSRVEQSKEVMRWAVVQDVDGSCEYPKVKLEPSDWANKCIDKINMGTNQTKTAEWYTWEINRLEKTNQMLSLLKTSPPVFAPDQISGDIDTKLTAAEDALKAAMKEFVEARQKYQTPPPALAKDADQAAKDKAKTDRQAVVKAHEDAQKKLHEAQTDFDKLHLAQLSNKNKTAQNTLFTEVAKDKGFADNEITSNKEVIERYKTARDGLLQGEQKQSAAVRELAVSVGIPEAMPDEAPATPSKDGTPPPRPLTDFFTPITVEVSASSDTKTTETSSTSFSFGASASWGIGSVSVSGSHSESHSKATSELVNSSVKISFEVMRVDITRPWLRPELFYDDELVTGPGIKISPGFGRLKELMEGGIRDAESELAMYSTFPLYPTAFLVACNVVLEISGSTASLETYMNSSSSAGSASVGYGPFSCNASASHSKGDSKSVCKTTASGCRIEIKAPQIIGWVSQLVPALPRLSRTGQPKE